MKNIIKIVCAALLFTAGQGRASLTLSAGSDVSPLNLAIPDNSPNAGVLSDVSSSAGGLVGGIESVSFSISGGWDGDYTVVLEHTDGTTSQSVTLLNMLLGGAAANSGLNVTISTTDSGNLRTAGSAVSTAPVTGSYGASASGVSFSPFIGTTAGGDWLLYVVDNQAGDAGMLSSWSVTMDVVPEPVNAALVIFGGLAVLAALARSMRRRPPSTFDDYSRGYWRSY